jgi:hypothetical protein
LSRKLKSCSDLPVGQNGKNERKTFVNERRKEKYGIFGFAFSIIGGDEKMKAERGGCLDAGGRQAPKRGKQPQRGRTPEGPPSL